jgi:membrane associated rhomboid family serine protease
LVILGRRPSRRRRAIQNQTTLSNGVGIYDREYYRQEERRPGFSLPASWSVVGAIIVVNVAVWVIDFFTGNWLCRSMADHVYTLTKPWLWWQFLTSGFAHAPEFQHILFNMLTLFFLGRSVEERYGSKEFLRLYLVILVFSSIMWSLTNKIAGTPPIAGMFGASGAIAGVVVLFALNFPRSTILLFYVLPMPAWVLGVIVVGMDIFGALGGQTPGEHNIAYAAHLAGAAFAFVYYWQQWNITRMTEGIFSWMRLPSLRSKPRLRVLRPDAEPKPEPDLAKEVDRILEKISKEGEAGLTAKERRTLEKASREYQRRRGMGD